MAISMDNSSLRLSEIHVNFLSYRYQKQCNKALASLIRIYFGLVNIPVKY